MMSLKFETTVLWICMFLIISSCSQHKNQSITKKIYKEVLKEALLYHTKNDLKLLNNSCLVLTLGAKNIDFRLDAIKNYLLNHKELISDSFEQLLINDARTYENLGLDLVKPYNLQLNSSESRRQELGNCSNDLGIITIFIPYVNYNKNRCVVLLEHLETAGKGYGEILLLKKEGIQWKITGTHEVWTS